MIVIKMKVQKTGTVTVGIKAKGYGQKEKVKSEVGGNENCQAYMNGYVIIVRQWVLCDGLTMSQEVIDYFLASGSGCPHVPIG